MQKVNHNVLLLVLLSLPFAAVSAEDLKDESKNEAFDALSCSAFFAVMAQRLKSDPEVSRPFTEMSEVMNDYVISLADQDFSGNTLEDMASRLMQKMQQGPDSAKYVVDQYAPFCRGLLEKVITGKK